MEALKSQLGPGGGGQTAVQVGSSGSMLPKIEINGGSQRGFWALADTDRPGSADLKGANLVPDTINSMARYRLGELCNRSGPCLQHSWSRHWKRTLDAQNNHPGGIKHSAHPLNCPCADSLVSDICSGPSESWCILGSVIKLWGERK